MNGEVSGAEAPDAVVAALRAAGCVFAEDEARLLREASAAGASLPDLLAARVAGQPLEHLLGWVEFAGLRLRVGPGVFVPRQRTRLLAARASALALAVAGGVEPPRVPVVVDACCGCGAVAAVVATTLARRGLAVDLWAVDVDAAATACARANLAPLRGRVLTGDLLEPLPGSLAGCVDVLAVNAPYVPTAAVATMPPEARLFEPRGALDGGPDGLDVHRRLVAAAPRWLTPTGHLLVETGRDQAPVMAGILAAAGFTATTVRDDDLDAWVVVGQRRGTAPP